MAQIPLALKFERHASFESFVAGANLAAMEHVRSIAGGGRPESVWLAGPDGTGKTHLLAAGCRAAGDAGAGAMYLALDAGADPAVLVGLDAVDVLALDDLDRVAGLAAWEQALFAVFDARLQRGGLLLAATGRPQDCGFGLPDLVSRANATSIYRLAPLDDRELASAVTRQAELRGLDLDAAAASFLLQRLRRDLTELTAWLDRIDRVSLARQRRVTIPLLREIIAAADGEAG